MDVLNQRDRTRLVGGQVGVVDERGGVGDLGGIGGLDDARAIATRVLGRSGEGPVCREVYGRRHVAPAGAPCPQKNASVRISMLSRGRAWGGEVGSSKAVCAVQRARPSFSDS